MAEVGIAASILGIVGFALQLSKKLYGFSTTTSTAGEEICFVARNVTNYADALEILADRLNDDDPVHSKRALKVVCRLYDQSCDLFDRIDDMIPEPKFGRDDISFLQKVAWNFKKSKVHYLAGHIESLKSTVTLLVAVLFAGKRIRARRKSNRRRKPTSSDDAAAKKERMRVSIAFVEEVEAYNKLPELKRQAAVDTRLPLEPGGEVKYGNGPDQLGVEQLVADIPTLNLQLGSQRSSEDQKQLVLHHPDEILSYLIDQYTNLAEQTPQETHPYTETTQKVLRTDTELSEAQKTNAFPEARESSDRKMKHPGNHDEKPSVKSYRKPGKIVRERSPDHWTPATEEPDLSTYSSLRTKQQQQYRGESDDSEQFRRYETHTERERRQVRSAAVEDKREHYDEERYESGEDTDQSLEHQHYEHAWHPVEETDRSPIYGIQDIQKVVDNFRSEWLHIITHNTKIPAAAKWREYSRFKTQVIKAINEAPELRPSSSDKQDIVRMKRAALKMLERELENVDITLNFALVNRLAEKLLPRKD